MPIHKMFELQLNYLNQYSYRKHKPFKFNRERLPKPVLYYATQFPNLATHAEWVSVRCCFHEDQHPSLRINVFTGAFRCFGCGAKGRDVVAFHQLRYQLTFIQTITFLGAWNE